MAIAHSHLQAAGRILSGHDGKTPFPEHARAYFRMNKQHGGRDRKAIMAMCYANLRMGASLPGTDMETRTIAGLFLTLEAPDRSLQELDAEWNASLPMSMPDKLRAVRERHATFQPEKIFHWTTELGGDIDPMAFSLSHLVQPDLFVRIRPGKEDAVIKRLEQANIPHEKTGTSALRLHQGADLASLFTADKDIVIQDLSSQRVVELLAGCKGDAVSAWDCCAGSGGKSILLHDLFPSMRISASDVRLSILNNLRTRLESAGIKGAKTFAADLEQAPLKGHGPFDIVLADVPCTGSGTWGRNPEWLRHFDAAQIAEYASRQRSIARNAAKSLKKGGCFLYVTCSVFRKENEEVVAFLQDDVGLRLEEMRYLAGYHQRADSLFAARFTSPA